MKKLFILSLSVMFLFSCSTVKRNGYYQTKHYKFGKTHHKSLHLGKKYRDQKHGTGTLSATERAIVLNLMHADKQGPAEAENLKDRDQRLLALSQEVRKEAAKNEPGKSLNGTQLPLEEPVPGVQEDRLPEPAGYAKRQIISEPEPPLDDGRKLYWPALISFILGIAAFLVFPILFGVLAFALGLAGIIVIASNKDKYWGLGFAIVGFTLGLVLLILIVLIILVFMSIFV